MTSINTTAQRDEVLAAIRGERSRQDAKWGEQNHPDGTGPDSSPLGRIRQVHARGKGPSKQFAQGMADMAKQATDEAAEAGTLTFADILIEEVFEALAESDPAKLRTELIQTAAVATQWVEAIDRRTAVHGAAEFGPDECNGSGQCTVSKHVHGCHSDLGRCDDPADHEVTSVDFALATAAAIGVSMTEGQVREYIARGQEPEAEATR